ncbi:hypothetical protein LPJ66_005546 [Kickxella alabastrina]|uniref:Uncharacterized protein n=1 Tax=Kickxella alabastrina TaxID=61397 RepID=A0ACC1IGI2_9FUNG|nr:hypothetical protein LPJ66_005546 [Kickxella alabastrina]
MKLTLSSSLIAAAALATTGYGSAADHRSIVGRDAMPDQNADIQSLIKVADDHAKFADAENKKALASLLLEAGISTPVTVDVNNEEDTPTFTKVISAEEGAATTPSPTATTLSQGENVIIVTEIVTVTASRDAPAAQDTSAQGTPTEPQSSPVSEQQQASASTAEEQQQSPASTAEEQQQSPASTAEEQQQQSPASTAEEQQQSPASTAEEQQQTSASTPQSSADGSGSDTGGSDTGGETFSGDGTYYNPSVGTGSCGTLNSDSELVAAINAPQYGTDANPNNAAVCGKCILVKGPNGQVKVTVVDKCPPCKQGDLDLSPAAFEQIAEFDQGRVPITWQFVSC